MTLWTAEETARATGGYATRDWQATGVSIDTRTLEPGDLFVALKDVRDGHDFVAQALQNGAAAALVSLVPDDVPPDSPLLVVDDVQAGLEALGRAGRARSDAKVVAVTGSVGKTSTKDMLRHVLGAQGKTHAAEASYNNHWGVPLTLSRLPADADYAVIEIGMNHPGEIAPLARMARPHVAMITTVAPVHLEAFDNGVDGIAREKASIFEGLEPGGVAIFNGDVETAPILASVARTHGARQVVFGTGAFDYRLVDAVVREGMTVVQAEAGSMPMLFKIASRGRHFAMNALGVLAATEALGADLAIAASDLAGWQPYRGRGVVETIALDAVHAEAQITLIDDAYNANPTSLGASFDVLAATPAQGRRIAFVGDMKELGPQERDLHAGMAHDPAIASIDEVHCVGPLMQALYSALPEHRRGLSAETSAELAAKVAQLVRAGDVVLVKGSLSMQMARIVDAVRNLGHGSSTRKAEGV